ncbi:MAG: VCBS repeat-containing protein [Candidatus Sumerlaeia bacterium]|nr:VCBS repeat-containing protein [Candidatus Sumerlaeia bacterium]
MGGYRLRRPNTILIVRFGTTSMLGAVKMLLPFEYRAIRQHLSPLLAAVPLLQASAAAWADPSWKGFPFPTIEAAVRPLDIVTADFNGDGILDLAVGNSTSSAVSVHLGNGTGGVGDGTFAPKFLYPAAGSPSAILSEDFNSDGILDLAVANSRVDSVSVFLGNGTSGVGDGTFAAQTAYGTARLPTALTTGDFNGDGILDIATANTRADSVSILLGLAGPGGTGSGTFAVAQNFSAGNNPGAIITADFNGDSIFDLVTANSESDDVSLLLGSGNGTFASPVHYPAGSAPQDVLTVDLNGDSILDLIVANQDSQDVSILFGNGSNGGADGSFAEQVRYNVGGLAMALALGDLNEDGVTDITCCTWGLDRDSVAILLGNGVGGVGDGTFGFPSAFFVSDDPSGIAVGDFNQDGITDLATADSSSNKVTLLVGLGENGVGHGTFFDQEFITFSEPVSDVAAADLNGDSVLDLAVASPNGLMVSVLLGGSKSGIGDGTFSKFADNPVPGGPRSVMPGDFDDDGAVDLITGNDFADKATVILGGGDGTFAIAAEYAAGDSPNHGVVGDFNGDGISDFAIANLFAGTISVFLGNGSAGSGDGTFAPAVNYAVGEGPRFIAAGDFNSDGVTDLAAANIFPDTVSILFGNSNGSGPDGTFAPQVTLPTGDAPYGIVAADLNSDGIMDIATANLGSDSVSVLLGNGTGGMGNGTFANAVEYPVGDGPYGIVAADLSGDGILDIATANQFSDNVTVLPGNGSGGGGDGTFGPYLGFDAGYSIVNLEAADFNGDGFLDLVTANGSSDISVLLNLGRRAEAMTATGLLVR